MTLETWVYPVLFCVGIVAGLVDAIAGGGGIITVSALLYVGFPVPLALGTNKLQATFGSVSAAWHYARGGWVEWRSCVVGVIFTLVGALAGAGAVQRLDPGLLQRVVPWLLVAVVVYTALRPAVGQQDHPPRMSSAVYFILFGLVLGFYDGFLGPGTGSFWTISMVALLGFNFLKATATTKVMNATSNIASLAVFILGGTVDYPTGFVMGAGQLIGARIGARLAMTRGARFVRPIFLTMVVAILARPLWQQFVSTRP